MARGARPSLGFFQTRRGGPALTTAQAWAQSQEMPALPQVIWLAEAVALEAQGKRCAHAATVSPKVRMAYYLAAFAIAGNEERIPFDRDFAHITRHGLPLRLLAPKAAGTRKPTR